MQQSAAAQEHSTTAKKESSGLEVWPAAENRLCLSFMHLKQARVRTSCVPSSAGFPHLLAAACDDGAVRLFGVEGGEPGLQMERTLAVLHGRLLSCAWHPTGEVMAVGGVEGTVHVLDAVGGERRCLGACRAGWVRFEQSQGEASAYSTQQLHSCASDSAEPSPNASFACRLRFALPSKSPSSVCRSSCHHIQLPALHTVPPACNPSCTCCPPCAATVLFRP